MAAYSINIVGLSNKEHHFQFEFGGEFFRSHETNLVSEGKFQTDLTLTKHETFIEVKFKISGAAHLVCDRSLEPFDFPIESNTKIVFKYGDEYQEITEEIVVIPRDTATLELGQYIYEFIALAIPLKKLHPKYQAEEDLNDDSEGKIVYSSGTIEEKKDEEEIDPRWNILKKLK